MSRATDEKKAHLLDLKREHLIDQVWVQIQENRNQFSGGKILVRKSGA